jgi:hypothetical protein
MQGKDTNIIVVTDKVKSFVGKFGLWVRQVEGKSLDMFPRLKKFVEEDSVQTSVTKIDQCINDHLFNLQSRLLKYFPQAICDTYK